MEKYAVEEQDGSACGRLGRRMDRAIRSVVERGDAVLPAPSRAQGIEQHGLELLVVVRVMEESFRRAPAFPVSNRLGIVEGVDGSADDGSAHRLQHLGQLFVEVGLA